jgi:peptidoglycan/xylan/chitin deacetylase (PgdA/CDA1 family)
MLWLLAFGATACLTIAALWTVPRWLVPRLAAGSPACLYAIPTRAPVVALTLDDGPDAAYTPRILDLLRAHGASATFFLISERVSGREEVVSKIVRHGHEIGNHMTREEASIRLHPAVFERGAREAGAALAGYAPVRWLRPGSGWYDARMLATVRTLGYRCALGSIYPFDANVPSPRLASAYILANVRPGAVIVLHEGGARGARAVRTLERVLPALRRRGYEIVTLSQLEQRLERSGP